MRTRAISEASLDRIDSDGHYEDGTLPDGVNNLQLVTHWYNMAKGTRTDAQMRRLLGVHASQIGSRQLTPQTVQPPTGTIG